MDLSQFELLRQGAEARIYKGVFLGQQCVVKERFSKKYRHPDLDARLTKERIKAEARALIKCKTLGIRTPTLYTAENELLIMEYLNSPTARDFIRQVLNFKNEVNEEQKEILTKLGREIGFILAQLHKNGVIHGDLTTSNILVEEESGKLCFIDFGLGHSEGSTEDKGVDLYVLERALISAHPSCEFMFEAILQAYEQGLEEQGCEVVKKYQEIRMRGRKRTMVG